MRWWGEKMFLYGPSQDHRSPRHVSECSRRKTLAHAFASQIVMYGGDIGDLQGDVAPAARLTNRIYGRSAVLLEKKQAVSQAKGRTARPWLLGEAEDIAIEPPVFAEAPDPHCLWLVG